MRGLRLNEYYNFYILLTSNSVHGFLWNLKNTYTREKHIHTFDRL